MLRPASAATPPMEWYARAAAMVALSAALVELAIGGYCMFVFITLGLLGHEGLESVFAFVLFGPAVALGVIGWLQVASVWTSMKGSRGGRLGMAVCLGLSAALLVNTRFPAPVIQVGTPVLVLAALGALVAWRNRARA